MLRLARALDDLGRVVDDEDRPQKGFKVFVTDPTFFARSTMCRCHVEGLLSRVPGAPRSSSSWRKRRRAPTPK